MFLFGTVATSKVKDYTVSENRQEKGKSQSWNKRPNLCSNTLIFKDEAKEAEKGWKKRDPTNTNNSTLSLHIEAYENSAEAAASDSNCGDKTDKSWGKYDLIKKQQNPKEIVTASTFVIQNPFEVPRQQNDRIPEPEVSQFRASQRLVNPNESLASVSLTQAHSAESSNGIPTSSETADTPTSSTPLLKKPRAGFTDEQKQELLDKIKNQDYELASVQGENDILMYVIDAEKTRKAVQCTICGTFMSAKSGGSLTYHRNSCLRLSDIARRLPYPVGVDDRNMFVQAVLKSLTTNYLSASLFNNEVFLELLQLVHNLGYKIGTNVNKNSKGEEIFGPASIVSMMPHRTNIRRTLDRTVCEKFPMLVELVANSIAGGGGSLICDMTTKLYHYVGYAASFITNDWNLVCVPVSMKEFSERPTAENILNDAIELLNVFGIALSDLFFVTDEGSNVLAAFSRQKKIVCINHGLNTVVKRSLNPYKETRRMTISLTEVAKAAIEELNALVKSVKELVQYVKRRPNLNTQLDLRLILDAETRWMSKLSMVKRVLHMSADDIAKLREYLTREDVNMLNKFDLIRHQSGKLQIFVDMFEPFLDAMRTMEAENRPTLYLVPYYYSKLLTHVNEARQSTDTTKAGLAESVAAVMEYKQTTLLTEDHYMALMLNPKHNGLVETIAPEKVDTLCDRIIVEGSAVQGETHSTTTNTKFASRKRRQPQNSVELELDEYLNVSVEADSPDFCLLKWWKENACRFPHLSALAKKYHSIPATSAAVERLFSVLNMLTPDERLSLTPVALENMIKFRAILKCFP